MFGNNNFADGYDGNVYGLVLNVNGVVINGFIETRPSSAIGNQDIYLQDITIKNKIDVSIGPIKVCPETIRKRNTSFLYKL